MHPPSAALVRSSMAHFLLISVHSFFMNLHLAIKSLRQVFFSLCQELLHIVGCSKCCSHLSAGCLAIEQLSLMLEPLLNEQLLLINSCNLSHPCFGGCLVKEAFALKLIHHRSLSKRAIITGSSSCLMRDVCTSYGFKPWLLKAISSAFCCLC